jgi:hypothetical protein
MLKTTIAESPKGKIILMDSITKLAPGDEGSVVLSASHGGASSGEFALVMPLKLVLFNDAGIGRDKAGIAALDMLEEHGVGGAAISHISGRIGDAQDMWEHGIISAVNNLASGLGLGIGDKVSQKLLSLI